MIRLLLILLTPFLLNASKILSYNIYDRTDRVDVMITFDTPYDGVIKQSVSESKIIIKLEDASIESSKTKELSSKFLHSLAIVPMPGYTQIIASVPSSVILKASKTSDSYGLRLRFTTKQTVKNYTANENTNLQSAQNPFSALPTKKSDDISNNYYIVVGILIIGIIILFALNKKIAAKTGNTTPKQGPKSWLFKNNQELKETANGENVTIRFQKNINENNSVVMLDFGAQSYLVIMGPNNILLDKFTDNKPVTQDDFDAILQNRHQELEDFLQNGSNDEKEPKEPLEIYKEKAAGISYEA
jgi:hypothetical protein